MPTSTLKTKRKGIFRTLRRLAPGALGLALLLGLAGCLLPVRFDSEITITRSGFYTAIFDGYVVSVPLFEGLANGKIDAAKESAEVKKLRDDLTRDKSLTEFKYISKGFFKMHWKRQGDLTVEHMIAFPRRNEAMFSLSYVKTDGRVTVMGADIRKSVAERLNNEGLGVTGQLRVRTDAPEISNNADLVDKKGAMRVYIWNVNSLFRKTPKLVLTLR